MRFYIFSYNRGRFLDNCVTSIRRSAPSCEIFVFDDNSDDAETCAVLERLTETADVVIGRERVPGKHGGLYRNMQLALEHAQGTEAATVCFVQDDMQMVRRLEENDFASIARFFDRHPQAGFLSPNFEKGAPRAIDEAHCSYDAESGVYMQKPRRRSAGVFYSDIFIARVSRLSEAEWSFRESEPANDRQAARCFLPLANLFAPFMMWLPNGPAFRARGKTWALRRAESKRACGFFPFEIMSDADVAALKQRDSARCPTAEEYLRVVENRLQPPWRYYPLEGSRWLKQLNSLELRLRRLHPGHNRP